MHQIQPTLSADSAATLGNHLFEHSPDCMKLLDGEGRLLAMNRNGRAVMDIDDFGAVAGACWRDFWPRQTHADFDAAFALALEGGGGSFSAPCPTFKGKPKWWEVRISALPAAEGAPLRLVAVSRDITEEQHMREQLAVSDARYRSLATASAAIAWSTQVDGAFDGEQPAWGAYTGQSVDAYRGWGWLEAVHPDDRAVTAAGWRRAIQAGTVFLGEHRLRRADGAYRDMHVKAVPMRGADGAIVEWIGVHTDVTPLVQVREDRERLLRELLAANQRMSEVFKRAPAFMCVLSGPEHVFELVNERYVELVGERPLLGLAAGQAVPELVPQGLLDLLDRVYRSGQPYSASDLKVNLQRTPGAAPEERYVDLVFIALRDGDGAITGLLGHGIDQTHRKLAEIGLHDSRERFQKIVSQAATGVVEMDVDGKVTLVNGRFCAMLGYTEDELLGRSILDVTAPASLAPTQQGLRGLMAGGQGFQIDKEYQRKDGSLVSATSSVNALRDSGGEYQGVVAMVLDTTESKRAAEALRRLADDLAETDRRKTEFLATLAHELRNPLAPIRSGLGVMRLNRNLPPAMVRVRDMMERQVSHMVHLIDDLLDVARISGGKLNLRIERVALNTVLAGAVETSLPLIEAAGHTLALDLPATALAVDGDATRIAQVVSNLLNNAAKYTPAGGRIGLALQAEGGQAVIRVSDSGIGIPQHALHSVFDMFSQVGSGAERAQGGLGIGLSLVRQLVRLHGGSVDAESGGAGAGSRFTVRLPLAADAAGPAAATSAAAAPAVPGANGLRVLVVDDNVDAAQTLAMILDLDGYTTRVAHSGPQALEAVAAFGPAVVFLDLGMPGMDGYATAAALRRLPGADTPCLVALTGWGADHDRARTREAGFDHHLTKPVELDTVQQLLADMAAAGGCARPCPPV